MGRRVSQGLLVLAVAMSVLLFWWSLGHPQQELYFSIWGVVLIGTSVLLERFFPFRESWNRGERGELGGDVASFVLIAGALDALLQWCTPLLVLGAWQHVVGNAGQPWGAWPLWLECLVALLLVEFGAYWIHRWHHRTGWLWQLHAVHHSPRRLYTWNNFRFHPLNYAFNHLAMMLLPLLLGFSTKALLGALAVSLPVLLLQHANLATDYGRLNWLFNTSELHRWHHAADPSEGHANYGRALVLWDHVFETFRDAHKEEPSDIGLSDADASFPAARRLWAQWMRPLRCCGCCQGN